MTANTSTTVQLTWVENNKVFTAYHHGVEITVSKTAGSRWRLTVNGTKVGADDAKQAGCFTRANEYATGMVPAAGEVCGPEVSVEAARQVYAAGSEMYTLEKNPETNLMECVPLGENHATHVSEYDAYCASPENNQPAAMINPADGTVFNLTDVLVNDEAANGSDTVTIGGKEYQLGPVEYLQGARVMTDAEVEAMHLENEFEDTAASQHFDATPLLFPNNPVPFSEYAGDDGRGVPTFPGTFSENRGAVTLLEPAARVTQAAKVDQAAKGFTPDGWTRKAKVGVPTVHPSGKASVLEVRPDSTKEWRATINGVTLETVFKSMKAAKEHCDKVLAANG